MVGKGDLYVRFQFGKQEKKTSVKKDTQHPDWEEGFEL
jgi:hypothetical protein